MRRPGKYTLQTLGFALIVMGIVLIILGLVAGPSGAFTSCPLNGPCPLPWYWWVPGAAFFSGIALVIAGIILLVVSRGMKPQRETDAPTRNT